LDLNCLGETNSLFETITSNDDEFKNLNESDGCKKESNRIKLDENETIHIGDVTYDKGDDEEKIVKKGE